MVKVRYIGRQPRKQASSVPQLSKSAKVWIGHGDVQECTPEEAALLTQPLYDKIWELVKDKADPAKEQAARDAADAQRRADEKAAQDAADEKAAREQSESNAEVTEGEVRARLQEIVEAIPKLKKSDFEGNTGKPKLGSLGAILKRKVTAIERDAAWDAVKAFSGTQPTIPE